MKNSILFSAEDIQKKVLQLADQINDFYKDEEILAICILKGAFIFYTDLTRHLNHVICDFCSLSFYGDSNQASEETIMDLDISQSVEGKNILIIDCIADHGHTIEYIKNHVAYRKPKSIRTVALVTKPQAHKKSKIDFSGFEVKQDVFVIGYGIDYQNEGRNLPHFSQVELN